MEYQLASIPDAAERRRASELAVLRTRMPANAERWLENQRRIEELEAAS